MRISQADSARPLLTRPVWTPNPGPGPGPGAPDPAGPPPPVSPPSCCGGGPVGSVPSPGAGLPLQLPCRAGRPLGPRSPLGSGVPRLSLLPRFPEPLPGGSVPRSLPRALQPASASPASPGAPPAQLPTPPPAAALSPRRSRLGLLQAGRLHLSALLRRPPKLPRHQQSQVREAGLLGRQCRGGSKGRPHFTGRDPKAQGEAITRDREHSLSELWLRQRPRVQILAPSLVDLGGGGPKLGF